MKGKGEKLEKKVKGKEKDGEAGRKEEGERLCYYSYLDGIKAFQVVNNILDGILLFTEYAARYSSLVLSCSFFFFCFHAFSFFFFLFLSFFFMFLFAFFF